MDIENNELDKRYREILEDIKQQLMIWRRHFHMEPELAFDEENTAAYIESYLEKLGISVKSRVGGWGIVAELQGAFDGPTIALRADMDALPIQEETNLSFASQKEGVMHACGHDGHMAILLGTATVLAKLREYLHGKVRFIFQPAEEVPPGGAKRMIEEGVLENVSEIYGLHLWSLLPCGQIKTVAGPMMAAADEFRLRIQGKGGHGGTPHQTVDTVLIASHLVMSIQHIVSRQIDPLQPAVITIGKIQAGSTFNVIADQAELMGTIRSFDPEVREKLRVQLEKTIRGVCDLYGADVDFQFIHGYPPVVNHGKQAHTLLEAAKQVVGPEKTGEMEPMMVGEDFSYYLEKIPGSFCFLGAGNEKKEMVYPHHHPRFCIDEEALLIGVQLFSRIIQNQLTGENK